MRCELMRTRSEMTMNGVPGEMAKLDKERGFTLVELAIAIIISGFMAVLIASLLNYYAGDKEKKKTQDSMSLVENAINGYFINSGGIYPCPSDITLPQSDPRYGVENRNPVTGQCQTTATFPAVNGRDVNGNTVADDAEKVLIGGVPYKSMSGELIGPDVQWSIIKQKDIIDGWGKQFTYVVTKGLTVKNTFDEDAGAIEVKDETDRSLLDVGGAAHVAIISHGKNGRGGYDRDGNLAQSCATVTLPPPPPPAVTTPPSELENCDGDDATFLSGLRTEADFAYNDDVVHFMTMKVSNLWRQTWTGIDTTSPSGAPMNIPQIRNANKGKVGIGVVDPQKELDVKGNFATREMRTPLLCDSTESFCVPPETIGGDLARMKCGAGQAIDYIEGVPNPDPKYPGTFVPAVHCVNVSYTPFGSDQNCSPGQNVVGITNFGRILCK